jgi:hypothetical protein
MSIVPATTAPDFRALGKGAVCLAATEGSTLELLVVAADAGHCAGVDLDSGALVRAWFADRPARRLRAYDVVEVTVAGDPEAVPDPSEPEAVVLAAAPEIVGRITGRRAEKLIRPLLHPRDAPLLGSHAPAVPFWERRADHPSIALVEPEGPTVLRREASYLACRFGWNGTVRELPCLDRRIAGEMDRAGVLHRRVDGRVRLVVALTPPIDGHCHKVVDAVLTRP